MTRILCVAEKPSISKAVAGHLSGGHYQTVGALSTPCRYREDEGKLTLFQNNTRDAYIKNYTFDFDFGAPWGHCSVTMTAVKGHLTAVEFPGEYKQWEYPPPDRLFDAPVLTVIPNVSGTLAFPSHAPRIADPPRQDNKSIAKNIEDQARRASALVIWTDCDREGEHIGSEIRAAARKGNAQIQIKRARFSNVERA
jgi:DNA topoisomerase-3